MKFCRFADERFGLVRDGAIYDVSALADRVVAQQPRVKRGDAYVAALPQIARAVDGADLGAPVARVDDAVLLSPVATPTKLIAAPVNYQAHIDEAEADKGITFNHAVARIDQAGLFLKATSSLVGVGEGVAVRFPERRTDHEIELALVIGETCANLTRENALDVVAGYAMGLDMSIRGTEDRSMRKSIDSYSVLGPWLVTADEIADPDNLNFWLKVNGEIRQQANTNMLLRDVRHLIVWASEWYTLYPGDVIYTGTPEGVAPVKAGDVMTAEMDRIGAMRVECRAAATAPVLANSAR